MIRAFGLALFKVVLYFLGYIVFPVMYPFRKTDESTRAPYTQYPELGEYVFTNFVGWWGNPCDGLVGDKRGSFAKWCVENGITPGSFRAMFEWAVRRNPANKWSRVDAGCDVSRCVIDKVLGDDVVVEEPGKGGYQRLIARRDDGKEFPRLFIVLPWFFRNDHAFLIDIGWKIKLSHNNTPKDARLADRAKGLVFTISPWKSLT